MSEPFSIYDYVDLRDIQDSRLLAEIRRTLEYFVTIPEGEALLKAIVERHHQPIHITDSLEHPCRYRESDFSININVHEIRDRDLYASSDLDGSYVIASTLPDTLWHELEHAGRAASTTPHLDRLMHKWREMKYGDAHSKNRKPPHKIDRFDQAIIALENKLNEQLDEGPIIAQTNKMMHRLYPGTYHYEQSYYSHGSQIDPFTPNAVNSGTLTSEQQAIEDAKYPNSPSAPDSFLLQETPDFIPPPGVEHYAATTEAMTPPQLPRSSTKSTGRTS